MKKTIITVMLVLGALVAQAALLVEDHFNYATTNLSGNTPAIGGTWGGAGATVVLGSGLTSPSGFAAASGSEIKFGSSGAAQTNQFASVNSGTVYMSYLVQFNTLKPNVGVSIGGLSINGAAEYAQLEVSNTTGNATFQLGLGGRSANLGPMLSAQYATGVTHLIVISYQFISGTGNDITSLWIDPSQSTFGAGSAPVANQTILAGTDSASFNTVDWKNSSAVPSNTILDELRVGTTWADVTPIPEPATIGMLGLGAIITLLIRRMRN